MKVTIKDIAREAGVSVSAVSLVLNKKPCRISQQKRRRIQEVAEKYSYVPNQIARSLAMSTTKTVGLIIPDIGNLFFSSFAKFLEEYCRERGYLLFIASSNDRFSSDLELLDLFSARSVDGLFIIVSNESYLQKEKMKRALSGLSFPFVMADRFFTDFPCDQVYFDNETGSYEAVSYLLKKGHREIGCVTAPLSHGSGMARFLGYQKAMGEYHCPIRPEWVVEGNYRLESGFEAAKKLLPRTTAAFVSNDMMGVGFLKQVYSQGKSVPEDYSLATYDDVLSPYLIDVSLTSVEQNIALLGEQACKLLFSRMEDPKKKGLSSQQIVLPPKLLIRNSVLPYSKALSQK